MPCPGRFQTFLADTPRNNPPKPINVRNRFYELFTQADQALARGVITTSVDVYVATLSCIAPECAFMALVSRELVSAKDLGTSSSCLAWHPEKDQFLWCFLLVLLFFFPAASRLTPNDRATERKCLQKFDFETISVFPIFPPNRGFRCI